MQQPLDNRKRLYKVRAYWNAKPHAQLQRERETPGISDALRQWHEFELSQKELQLNSPLWAGTPVIGNHYGNEPNRGDPVAHMNLPRMALGEVYTHEYDAATESVVLGLRAFDGPLGHWMMAMFEDAKGIEKSVSIGHRIWKLPNGERRISIDEVSLCVVPLRPYCHLLEVLEYEYPAELKWDSYSYNLPPESTHAITIPPDILVMSAKASVGSEGGSAATAAGDGKSSSDAANAGAAVLPPTDTTAAAVANAKRKEHESTAGDEKSGKMAKLEGDKDVSDAASVEDDDDTFAALEPFAQAAMNLSASLDTIDAREKFLKAMQNAMSKDKRKMEKVKEIVTKHKQETSKAKTDIHQAQRQFVDTVHALYKVVGAEFDDNIKHQMALARDPPPGYQLENFIQATAPMFARASYAFERGDIVLRDAKAAQVTAAEQRLINMAKEVSDTRKDIRSRTRAMFNGELDDDGDHSMRAKASISKSSSSSSKVTDEQQPSPPAPASRGSGERMSNGLQQGLKDLATASSQKR